MFFKTVRLERGGYSTSPALPEAPVRDFDSAPPARPLLVFRDWLTEALDDRL